MRAWMTVGFMIIGLVALPMDLLAQEPAVSVVSGTVLGADGARLKLAQVRLLRPRDSRRIASSPVTAQGAFALATADSGAFYLEFTGVDHDAEMIPVLLRGGDRLALEVRLKRYTYTDSLERVVAIGDFNRFDFSSGRPLARQADGRYTLEIETTADTLAYQLLHLETSSRSINGTQAEWYVSDNGGDYRSVIRAQNGRATIVLDPSALVRVTEQTTVTFRDTLRGAGKLAAELARWRRERAVSQDSARAARSRRETPRFDWTPAIARRTAALAAERSSAARQLLFLELLDPTVPSDRIDPALARRAIEAIPPSSPWWSLHEFQMAYMVQRAVAIASGRRPPGPGTGPDTAATRAVLAYLDRVLAEHPDSLMKSDVLVSAVFSARTLHEDARSNEYYTRLMSEYPNSSNAAFIMAQYAPNRALRPGAPFPAFRMAALDDSSVVYSNESMAGKPFLVEFWATWCGPCITEMPQLHAAHDTLGAEVEFLSISLDERPDDVRNFRRGEWRMPWQHAFATGGFNSPDMRRMEIIYLPRSVLVGRDGRIMAVDFRGENIVPTVRRALAEAAATP